MSDKRKPNDTGKAEASESESSTTRSPDEPDLPEEAELVLKIRTETGEITQAEWLSESGERADLSDEELLVLEASLSAYQETGDVTLEEVYEENPSVYEIAYQHGMADYEACLIEEQNYTPEELAYYQGAADYASLL